MSIDLPGWARAFIPPARLKIAHGGRGSGKSWTFARMLILRAAEEPVRILCARELQNSIQDSVHQLISDQIRAMDLAAAFVVQEKNIVSRSGAQFMFKGLRGMKNDAKALKSLEGVDICWIEEGQTVSAASLETLTPTIRKQKSEIWITFNPDQETDPVYKLAMNPPDSAIVRQVNYDQNPWFHETSLPEEMEWMRRTDPDAYAHVWLGECRRFTDAQIMHGKYCIDAFEPNTGWDGPYFGADWGFNPDPTTLVKVWIGTDRRLYIEHEAYKVNCDLDDIGALFDTVPGSRERVIRADSSRPDTIRHVRKQRFNVVPSAKGPGSVEDGIMFIRSFEMVVIHPRCKHTAEEARLYSHKVDRRSNEILPDILDANNHMWDAVRYALEPLIKQQKQSYATSIPRRLI